MRKRLFFLLLVIATTSLSVGNAAVKPNEKLDAASASRVDQIVKAVMAEAKTPGVSLAVVRNRSIVYAKGYGVRDLGSGAPVEADTVFRFGSITKQLVAAAALSLAEQDRLSLSDPLSKWLPRLPHGQEIRLDDLLVQTSGYRDYYPLDYVDLEMSQRRTIDQIIAEYARFPLTAPPRTRWEYSNTNYTIAGKIIEKASGVSLQAVLQQRVFNPAGMRDTFFDEPPRSMSNRATGYNSYFTEPQHYDVPEAPFWLNSAAAVAGTASDLARFDIALLDDRILRPASLQQMTTSRVLPNGTDTQYGLGLEVGTINGHRDVEHGGNVIGFASSNRIALDDGVAVVVLTNSYEAPASLLSARVLKALLPVASPQPLASTGSAPPTPTYAPETKLVRDWLGWLKSGTAPRGQMTPDFAHLMDPTNTRRAQSALTALGPVASIDVRFVGPRGGLRAIVASVAFAAGSHSVVVFQAPDGKIAEVFVFS